MKNYTFLQTQQIQICKIYVNFPSINVYLRKTHIVKIIFKCVCAKINAKFLCRNCAI